jgi:ATP-dependent DNA ligase
LKPRRRVAEQLRFERPRGSSTAGDVALVVLDDAGRPPFDELLFGRRRPTCVAFDLLFADGVDLRRIGKHAEAWDRQSAAWEAVADPQMRIVGRCRYSLAAAAASNQAF